MSNPSIRISSGLARRSASRRRVIAGLTLAGALATAGWSAVGASTDPPNDEVLELRLAVATTDVNPVTESVLTLAGDLGYFEDNGIEVTYVPLTGTPEAVAALNSGDVDIADISIDAALRLDAEGQLDTVGIVSGTLGPPFLIASADDIETLDDLAGRSFAIADSGSLDSNLTRAALSSLDIDPDGPAYVAIGAPASRVQALAAGQVDATTVSYGSFLPIADTPGIHILLPPDEFYAAVPVQSKFIVATATTVAEKPEALQRFTNAIIEISRDFDADAGPWVQAVSERRDDLAVEDLEATVPFLEGRWCVNGCINPDMLAATVEFIYSTPDFEGVPVVSATDLYDESFVLSAIEALGPYDGGGLDER